MNAMLQQYAGHCAAFYDNSDAVSAVAWRIYYTINVNK